jgi:anti-sigma B factor antagonist
MPNSDTVFFVNAYDDPVQLVIKGRACFQNARPVSQFFDRMIAQGKREFIVDFEACSSMDSTFLGILAGAGIRLMEQSQPGRMHLARLSERNRELVVNLGLDQIVEIAGDDAVEPRSGETASDEQLDVGEKLTADENARMVLKAHENLVDLDASNLNKFQDVIQFLRNQVEE